MSREAPRAPTRHISTLVYALRDGRLALIRRAKAPNLGLWSPPGGKLDPGETPLACALRELAEETGLGARAAVLRAIVTEWDPARAEAWLMFAFRVDDARGELGGDQREGRAAWVPLAEVAGLPAPPADAHILRAVLEASPDPAFVHVLLDDGRLVHVAVEGGGPGPRGPAPHGGA